MCRKKLIVVALVFGVLICSQGDMLRVFAAKQDHVHTWTLYERRLVYQKTERNCVYDASCEITTSGYESVYICKTPQCGAKKSDSQTTTSHSVHH